MARWLNDPEVRENLGVHRKVTLETTVEWIARAISDPSICAFAVMVDDEHVGSATFDQIDARTRSARFSLYIGELGRRGQGLAGAASSLALGHAFYIMNLERVWLTVHVMNHRAIRTYLKAGFVVEGFQRKAFLLNGSLVGAYGMGLLSDEFQAGMSRPAD